MKKIAIIGIVGLPARYGGFESFVEQLVQRLWERYDLTVYCQRSAFAEHPDRIGKVNLKYLPLKANGIQSIPYDMLGILDALRYADSLLILGVGGCTLLPFLRLFGCRRKIVINIDGIEWRRASIQFVSGGKNIFVGESLNGGSLRNKSAEQAVVPFVLRTKSSGTIRSS